MAVSATLGIILVFVATAYCALAAYVWIHREIPGAAGLAVCSLALGVWTVCYALELSSTTIEVARVWAGLKFIGIVLLPPGLWAFVLRYTAQTEPLPKLVIALLLLQPVAVLTVLAIPQTHDLFHLYPGLDPATTGEQDYLGNSPQAEGGLLFWPHAIYTYVMLFGAVGLLVYRLARVAQPYRRRSYLLIAAAVLPFAGNVVFNLADEPMVDPTPFLFTVTAVAFVWGMLRLRLLGILKVARAVVVDRMADAVVVLDAYGRVADVNPAGEALLRASRSRLIGTILTSRVAALSEILTRHTQSQTTEGEITLDDGAVDVAVQVTSVLESGAETGRILVMRDVTERKATERRMMELLREETVLAQTLQGSLRPPTLPVVEGAELAARWVPAGVDGPLSGDFYDVHPAGQGRWAFVFGDVVGKGVHAAIVTARARYAARALSAQGVSPVDVMRALNEALLSEDGERFCTVVYGLVEARGVNGLRVRLVLGGHPPPLVRRRDGRITPVGTPGMALGLISPIDVKEVEVLMAPGEILLAYTDGVTEARAPMPASNRPSTDQFGEQRLAGVLAAAPPVAEWVADAVLNAVETYAVHRDDVALLVLAAT